jgi:hypothetical protein
LPRRLDFAMRQGDRISCSPFPRDCPFNGQFAAPAPPLVLPSKSWAEPALPDIGHRDRDGLAVIVVENSKLDVVADSDLIQFVG